MYARSWDTVDEMIADADAAYRAGRSYERRNGIGSASWVGRAFASWDDIKAKANAEWQEGLDVFFGMLHELQKRARFLCPPKDRRRKKRFADDGDDVDLDRLRSGQEFWQTCQREETQAPQQVTIFANVAALGTVAWDDILWRGAAAMVLADILEAAGYRVDVWGVRYSRDAYMDDKAVCTSVCMKRADQPMDVSTTVNAMSGWFFRTVFFQAQFVRDDCQPAHGMGYTSMLTESNPEVQRIAGNARTVVIDGVWSERAALDKIEDVLRGFQS